ncbi:MAG: tetratricopeptide repeat protein [Thermoplasmata archaeon]
MASAPFVQLAGSVVEAMGERLDAIKPTPEGVVVQTSDGLLYAFLEDPTKVSLGAARRLLGDGTGGSVRLVVLTPGHLPLIIAAELVRAGATLVEGPRFAELVRQLGLGTMLGEEPRAIPGDQRRLLPSAQQLDEVMQRGRTWLGWGVPALSLRFYRHAVTLKPEFVPAKIGLGRSLLALGLPDDADRTFDEVLSVHPDDVEARLGKAAVLGAKAEPTREVEVYRTLLAEDEARTEVRAHLVAALVDLGDWRSARVELEAMLTRTPEDPQLRFLHAVALTNTGEKRLGEEERKEARTLGLAYDREVALCEHLGLPVPERPPPSEMAIPPTPVRIAETTPTAPKAGKPARRARPPSAPVKKARPTRKRK